MIKKDRFGGTLKEQYHASAKDRLHRFLLADGQVRGAVVHGTRMIYEMRANHELGVLETLALGHGYLAGALMSSHLKGMDRVALEVEGAGPIQRIRVEANSFGDVRGFIRPVPIPVEGPVETFSLKPFFGPGLLKVTRYLEDAKHPFTGQVAMVYGSLAKDLANYFVESEQIPTAVALSIQFDTAGEVTGAGGLLLQIMPNADETVVASLETLIGEMPTIGAAFADGVSPAQLITDTFAGHDPKLLSDYRIEFQCHCTREQIETMVVMLPQKDRIEMRDNGPFPIEIRCHHCNTVYDFDQTDLTVLNERAEATAHGDPV